MGYSPIAYFFNPNIHPFDEYQKRLEAQKKLCKNLDCKLIIEDYIPENYNKIMTGYENHVEGSERCSRCFELRLLKTAFKARELGIENFDTSISISPHKNYNVLKGLGEYFSNYFNIDYLAINYKKQDGFLKTNKIAHEQGLYRQSYCGCSNSMSAMKKQETRMVNIGLEV